MLDLIGEDMSMALIGLIGGVALGLAARIGRFCTLGAIEDLFYGGDTRRLRMWGVAIGVAAIICHAAALAGLLDLDGIFYLSNAFSPAAAIVGGLIFGYGMALAGSCGFGALARLGGGDMRSFVVVAVLGVASYAALSGPLAGWRVALFPVTPLAADQTAGIVQAMQATIPISAPLWGLILGGCLLGVSVWSKAVWAKPMGLFWGAIVGLAVSGGFIGTHWVSQTGFEAHMVQSHTFSAPVGETVLWIMMGSALPLSFGIGSVIGVLLGALIGSIRKGHFRWEACDDPRELRRQITGAGLMGIGAVIASGCTIGQGVSAFALLAYSAPVTLAAIFLGAYLGLRQLIEGGLPLPAWMNRH